MAGQTCDWCDRPAAGVWREPTVPGGRGDGPACAGHLAEFTAQAGGGR